MCCTSKRTLLQIQHFTGEQLLIWAKELIVAAAARRLLGERIQSLSNKVIPVASQNEPPPFASHERAVWICEFD